jgi:ferredoxin-thioredoxin reductase catalytic subunit
MSSSDRERVEKEYERLDREAKASGYHLNPDAEFAKTLIEGMLVNEQRYGYWACPCRLASGERSRDRDIICPCDYRDPDVTDFGACYCALYVSGEVARDEKPVRPVPERRPVGGPSQPGRSAPMPPRSSSLPVWRCKVCGYLCARPGPPETCPICKVGKERFEIFWPGADDAV